MKKIFLLFASALMLGACSVPTDVSNILSPLFTPTPLPSATNTVYATPVTPSDTPTITATLPTPTFTETPTLMGGGFTATPTLTSVELTGTPSTPLPTLPTSPAGANSIFTPPYVGFIQIQTSSTVFRWGNCPQPSSITFTAQVSDPVKEVAVLLFLRLSSPSTGEETKWEAGAQMNSDKKGTFTYTITTKNISHYDEYPNAWLQYQLVAIDAYFDHVGYTQPYLNSITFSKC